ncbi:hypothetical protein FT663_01388 [Candidozyma haemuli var. vulneris]|uniref:Calcipressin n=1 Tax=Candidozyma haemuli TaxID=45357 RepID=A0A2V1AZ07_9ASCO|nr:hypothetical protein CXQ85_002770 [[Candida] haemuloni]KAF3992523.1 hypothetical protein FT662_01069 [[Candida] haemuloni var. vulneris]KAF3994475.1 hypothetical protein FT663_01388 [[Candida] haemuloni var. vulneris]PVH23044.1 hypothetical protein CXQ85_002770 [[Candida] haemuloni]
MARPPTNTLIVTRLSKELKDDPNVLVNLLAAQGLQVELISLPKFERYIIICGTSALAIYVRDYLSSNLGKSIGISFSLKDNHSRLLEDENWTLRAQDTQFLELPSEEGSRRFLISPPLSPQSEWDDYHKVEDGPNEKAIYSPEELSHLLWDRFGGFDSFHVKKYQDDDDESDDNEENLLDIRQQPEVLFENIDNGVPAIVVDSVRNQKSKKTPPLPKTTMPPTD